MLILVDIFWDTLGIFRLHKIMGLNLICPKEGNETNDLV